MTRMQAIRIITKWSERATSVGAASTHVTEEDHLYLSIKVKGTFETTDEYIQAVLFLARKAQNVTQLP